MVPEVIFAFKSSGLQTVQAQECEGWAVCCTDVCVCVWVSGAGACKRSACVHLDLPQTEQLYAKRSLWFEAETPVERGFGSVWKIKLKLTLQDRVEQDHPYYHHGKNKQNAIVFFFFLNFLEPMRNCRCLTSTNTCERNSSLLFKGL